MTKPNYGFQKYLKEQAKKKKKEEKEKRKLEKKRASVDPADETQQESEVIEEKENN